MKLTQGLSQQLKQQQILSQKQIQSLKILSMSAEDLEKEMYRAAEENPALIIKNFRRSEIRSSSIVSHASEIESDNNIKILESKEDFRESLQHHLMSQLNLIKLSKSEHQLAFQLIHHLDNKGFMVYNSMNFLDKKDPLQNREMLKKVTDIIQHLDPVGTCTKNFEESLLVQAKDKPEPNKMALFILDGHFSFLDPLNIKLICDKLNKFARTQKKLFALDEKSKAFYENFNATEEEVKEAVAFIQKLNPYPGAAYSTEGTNYISADVTITESDEYTAQDDFARGIIKNDSGCFKIKVGAETEPEIYIDPNLKNKDSKDIKESIKKAKEFLDSLKYRKSTLLTACCYIVKKQMDFFRYGPGNLHPLSQKDLAKLLNLHEATISRMAGTKYIQCSFGLIPIKQFFTNAVSKNPDDKNSLSQDQVMFALKKVIELHRNDIKKPSDQTLTKILNQQGIKIARRTVAKYRAKLNIESSYSR
ncbi:RNA polymerase factor sigma-54 [Treponema sp.]|uniref:RNA polymerase factor sigma-54 n=1 Tax=Treponema sp. TaxID=166 RepID=UPI00257D2C4B|nr:RNA polymerase factor sigma-54 [Treponema sp.]MBE6353793.1 RNA polymerase factor sigma-54 [Treponema sp.]